MINTYIKPNGSLGGLPFGFCIILPLYNCAYFIILSVEGGGEMKRRKYSEHVIFTDSKFDFDVNNAISSHECTGLIPWAPENEAELDAYDEIWNYSPESANVFNYED